MIQKLLTRLQNKIVLVSLFSGLLFILTTAGIIDVGMSDKAEAIFKTVLGILTALGVVSDPESHVNKEV